MKRIMLPETQTDLLITAENIPHDIADYMAGLKLLYYVPFAYLAADEAHLPAESIRFFYIDETWTTALADGALSIGRNDSAAAMMDERSLAPALEGAENIISLTRHKKVHQNHHGQKNMIFAKQEENQTGFIIRSALTRKWKGLEVTGFNKDKQLAILRCESVAADIIICIFDGVLTRVNICEPRAALRFGAHNNDRNIEVRSIEENSDFGRFIPGKKVTLKSSDNGCLNVLAVRDELEKALGKRVTPSVFTFELMLAAQKAAFTVKD